jgi:hypothetical protein
VRPLSSAEALWWGLSRLWAIDQLTVLDDPTAESVFRQALSDELQAVRDIAAIGIERLERKKRNG